MSRLLLHDSGRGGKLGWAVRAVEDGLAAGFVISPWQTPPNDRPRRPGVDRNRDALRDAGGLVLWDPCTYGAHAPASNDRDIYDRWGLWGPGGPRLTLTALRDHVERCVNQATTLTVDLLAPSLTLDSPQGVNARNALAMAEHALNLLPGTGITVAGTPGFWTAGNPLDAYIGELLSLRPGRVNVLSVRESLDYPAPGLSPDEVEGMARTIHSLGLHTEVMVGHGDLAALPGVVAGAGYVGSGWDLRHRVCALAAFRITTQGGGGTPPRVTHGGLLGVLKRVDAEALLAADAVRSGALVPGALPTDFNSAWRHHLRCLNAAVDAVAGGLDHSARYRLLAQMYVASGAAFRDVDALVGGLGSNATDWIDPLATGLDQYAAAEGL